MASYDFSELANKYDKFSHPVVVLKIENKDFSKNKDSLGVSDIEVELTSGYEASIASFTIYNCFDVQKSKFNISAVEKYIRLGSSVSIALGYSSEALEVFCGFVTRVNFLYPEDDMPGIKVTAMDVKGVMMASNYSRQLTATCYSEAVKEIFQKPAYTKLQEDEIIRKVSIADTPDKEEGAPGGGAGAGAQKASDRTMEMVCESDYEFVVRAAKKYNYEFFTECGTVLFRSAKSDTEVLIELSPRNGIRSIDVEYDMTGLVQSIEARGMDVGKGKVISAKKDFSNSISTGNDAVKYIKKSAKVYIDPTITSDKEAQNRVDFLMDDISYRFGTLECDCIGIPELLPGRFIKLTDIGYPPENEFYIVTVRHRLLDDRGFETKIIGKAASIGKSAGIGGGSFGAF